MAAESPEPTEVEEGHWRHSVSSVEWTYGRLGLLKGDHSRFPAVECRKAVSSPLTSNEIEKKDAIFLIG